MNPCACTRLTGECAHDCPYCGGEGVLPIGNVLDMPPREPLPEGDPRVIERRSKISPEEVDELLERSGRGVQELREILEPVFRLPSRPIRLR